MTPAMMACRTIALPGLSITAVCEPGADCRLALSGELDLASAGPLHTALSTMVTDHEAALVLDAGALRFCDASGLGSLVRTANFAEARGAGVTVTHASPMLAMLMSLTGLDRRFGVPPLPGRGAGRRPLPGHGVGEPADHGAPPPSAPDPAGPSGPVGRAARPCDERL